MARIAKTNRKEGLGSLGLYLGRLTILFCIVLIAALHGFFPVCPMAQLISEQPLFFLIFNTVLPFLISWVMIHFARRGFRIGGLSIILLLGY